MFSGQFSKNVSKPLILSMYFNILALKLHY